MAAVTRALSFTNSSDANFRSWAQAVHDILDDGGWVQTADTGQIDLVTVSAPGATDTSMGYEIWRTDDAAGSLVNFYIKIEYGSGASSATRPAIWLTIGWGSNGSGTLTGVLWTRRQITITTNPTGTPNIFLSAGDGYFNFWMGTSSTHKLCICLERTRDSSNAFQNEVAVFYSGSQETSHQVVDQDVLYPLSTSMCEASTGGFCFVFAGVTNTPFAAKVAIGLCFAMAPGPTSPSMNIVLAEAGALGPEATTVDLSMFGETITYMTTNTGVTISPSNSGPPCLVRYE